MGEEITKKDVIKLIEVRKEDTLLTHLKCFILNKTLAMGEVGNRKIKIWNPNLWNRLFYPIFEFEFNTENHLIKISNRLNPASKIFIFLIAFLSFFTFMIPIYSNFHLPQGLYYIIFISSFLLLIFYVFYKKYKFEKKNQLEHIYEILDIETEKENPENEWTLGKIITRLLLYPFSISIISLAILFMIPNGNYSVAFGCIAIFGTYLFIDLKTLLKKNK